MGTIRLHILNLEDNPEDSELIRAELASEGIDCEIERVETSADFCGAIKRGGYDLILADYTLPAYDGLSALATSLERCPEVPFIFVSGRMGEDAAIESLRSGATDYVLKDRLSRLAPALRRALKEAEERVERKRAEEEKARVQQQLLQSQKMEAVGQLAGGIAHDFNNILSAIIGFADLLMMDMDKGSRHMHYVEEISAAAQRATSLTHQILAFSRKQLMDIRPVNLNGIVQNLEKLLLRLIREDIELRFIPADRDLVVMADSGQMDQILINLVTNARDAMPAGGCLTISTGTTEMDDEFIRTHGFGEVREYALVSVADTGEGLDEDAKTRMFEPFFTTKEQGKGTGLGLSVVYGIVRQHEGFISVYSEPGQGTTFRIYLPLVDAAATTARQAVLSEVRGGPETLLIAEDDPAIRKLSKDVFGRFGYSVIEAVNGEDAVNKFVENRDAIRLVILDVIMPRKNGKDAYDEIRKINPGIKALFLSGYTSDDLWKKGSADEAVNFIIKPVSPKELLKKVREILDSPS